MAEVPHVNPLSNTQLRKCETQVTGFGGDSPPVRLSPVILSVCPIKSDIHIYNVFSDSLSTSGCTSQYFFEYSLERMSNGGDWPHGESSPVMSPAYHKD
jgi:hypothetical protein